MEYTKRFAADFIRLETLLQRRTEQKITLLSNNPRHPSLQVKKMVNQKNIYEARIDIHNRLTFEIHEGYILMRRVGTHEIYRNP